MGQGETPTTALSQSNAAREILAINKVQKVWRAQEFSRAILLYALIMLIRATALRFARAFGRQVKCWGGLHNVFSSKQTPLDPQRSPLWPKACDVAAGAYEYEVPIRHDHAIAVGAPFFAGQIHTFVVVRGCPWKEEHLTNSISLRGANQALQVVVI